MPRDIDVLTSPALKHVRDRWWDTHFSEFLRDTLQPQAGKRWLDVGCGMGTAERYFELLPLEAVAIVGVDVAVERVREAVAMTRTAALAPRFAAADAAALPFRDASFDATFCVAVLQHLDQPREALAEFVRVTRPGGRVVAVEPDNASRYWFSALDSGGEAYAAARRFFAASYPRASGDAAIGPHLPQLMLDLGLEPVALRLFPVTLARVGAPGELMWQARQRAAAEIAAAADADDSLRELARDYVSALERYAADAHGAGPRFVEIQHTMLFAMVGQRPRA